MVIFCLSLSLSFIQNTRLTKGELFAKRMGDDDRIPDGTNSYYYLRWKERAYIEGRRGLFLAFPLFFFPMFPSFASI